MTEEQNEKTLFIQKQNDIFRKSIFEDYRKERSMNVEGKHVFTKGVDDLDDETLIDIGFALFQFDEFTEDNDPHGEHDFGSFTCDGNKIFWKIDCYDTSFEYASEDPSDLDKTRRVLTVMLAEEY